MLLNDDLSEVDPLEETHLTQLDVVVNHIHDLYQSVQATTVERPWLPPLPDKIVTPHITKDVDVGSIVTHNLLAAIGMADIPEEQTQTEYVHNFLEDGNLAVFGASGFGKSTMMLNVTLTLASGNSPQLLHYFILDFGNSALAQLRGLPHTADYMTFDATEKLEKLVKLMNEELKKRKSLFASASAINFRMYNEVAETKLPAILLIIDNYDVIREINDELEEFLVKLTRDGTGVGIYTVITASRTSAVRYSVLNNFKNKISQFMFDESDISAVVGRCAYKLPEVRGRAIVKMKEAHIAQCYLPVFYENDIDYSKQIGTIISNIADKNTASKAVGVRVVPDIVVYEDLVPYIKANERQLVFGFNIETTEPVYMDLSIPCQLVVGSPSTGKTNILKLLSAQLKGIPMFVADSQTGDLNELEHWPEVTYMETASQLDNFYEKLTAELERRQAAIKSSGLRLREFCAAQPPLLVLIDDGDYFIELCRGKAMEMESVIPASMTVGMTFVTATHPSKLRGYDNLTKVLKDSQSGIVLGHPGEQNIYQIPPPRGYKAIPDVGFRYKRGDICQVKLPFMNDV